MEALQQCIVQFARDSRPLVDARFQTHAELVGQLTSAQLIESPGQYQKGGHACQAKPDGLVPERCNAKGKNGALLVPDAVVIARDYLKLILARTQARIEGLSAGARILPVFIRAFQLVTEFNPLRYRKA